MLPSPCRRFPVPGPFVLENANVFVAKAVAIPGLTAGMIATHEAFAALPWHQLNGPANEEALLFQIQS